MRFVINYITYLLLSSYVVVTFSIHIKLYKLLNFNTKLHIKKGDNVT